MPGTVGRPRVAGDRLPNLDVVLADPKTAWATVAVRWYDGAERALELASGTAVWYHNGMEPLPIRWVLPRDPAGRLEPRAYFSTRLEDDAATIAAEVVKRWPIEVTFEEARAHLGVETQRQWSDLAPGDRAGPTHRFCIGSADPVVSSVLREVASRGRRCCETSRRCRRRTQPWTVDAQGFVDGLKGCFADLKDPRNEKSCDHRLFDIVAIAVLSVACGADDWCDMATFARVKLDWLKTFLALPGGAPSHDTFRRVFGLLDRNQFAAHLFRWTQALHEATGGKLIAIDGKTQRRTFATRSGLRALHLVTAWASENGLTLGQVACEEKSNEITAIPELLKLLDLKGLHRDDRRDGLPDGDRRGVSASRRGIISSR